LDIPDVASIAAPKPMYLFDGENDTLFTAAGVSNAYQRLRMVWESQHAGDKLRTKIWPGLGHTCVQEMQEDAFTWFDQQFRVAQPPAAGQ
jgi:hypothetical protein